MREEARAAANDISTKAKREKTKSSESFGVKEGNSEQACIFPLVSKKERKKLNLHCSHAPVEDEDAADPRGDKGKDLQNYLVHFHKKTGNQLRLLRPSLAPRRRSSKPAR